MPMVRVSNGGTGVSYTTRTASGYYWGTFGYSKISYSNGAGGAFIFHLKDGTTTRINTSLATGTVNIPNNSVYFETAMVSYNATLEP